MMCWRCLTVSVWSAEIKKGTGSGCGSVFLWGIKKDDRRVVFFALCNARVGSGAFGSSDFVDSTQDAVDDRRWARRAAGDVHIDGKDGVDAVIGGVAVAEDAAAEGAGA